MIGCQFVDLVVGWALLPDCRRLDGQDCPSYKRKHFTKSTSGQRQNGSCAISQLADDDSGKLEGALDCVEAHAKQLFCQSVEVLFGTLDVKCALHMLQRFTGLKRGGGRGRLQFIERS